MLTFNVGTFAKKIGVHRNTVTNWIKKGLLKAYPAAAKRYSISRESFIAFCQAEKIPKTIMDSLLAGGFDPIPPFNPSSLPGTEAGTVAENTSPSRESKALPGNISSGIQPTALMETSQEKRVVGSALVVGGGIAGIQAALDLADSGFYVYLVEKSSGIGGTMAQLDKTFPTNDCASCILLPKLVECGRHLNIELITLAEVEKVRGKAGNFSVRIKQQPRYIDTDKCIACGICAQKCPISVKDDFNFGINRKKAISIKYDQAVPLKYVIDPGACIYLTHGKCRACEKFCPTSAINFEQVPSLLTITVGAVILAPGFKPFNPSGHDYYGHPRVKDVVTSLEYERLLSVSGPNKGSLRRPSDDTEPRRIAWLQCVGSRNHNDYGNSYCSNICCMAAVKQSMASIEHTKGVILDRAVFYMDLRSHGRESEIYFEKAKKNNVRFVRALPHTLEPGEDGTGIRLRYMTENGDTRVESFDMAVLSIGFEAPANVVELARTFNIELDQNNFARTSTFKPLETSREGIFVIGAFQTPKAISRSVVQSSAAAASVSWLLADQRNTLSRTRTYPLERNIHHEKPSIGVFVCSCGVNISGIVDVDRVVAYAARLPHVTYAENNLFSCSADAQESITEKIHEFKLNRIVIAACTPRTHEHMFQETLKSAHLNGFMVEMANIRNQNAWVHQEDPDNATLKAKAQIRMAVAKVVHNYPLNQEKRMVVQTALVVGGGVTGMKSALSIARLGIETILIERNGFLGGNALKHKTCFSGEAVPPMLEDLIHQTERNNRIRIYKNTTLDQVSGSIGNFTGLLNTRGKSEEIRFGAAIMATGAKEATASEYLYGQDSRVMTQIEFDTKVVYHPDVVKKIQCVVFIQCVGSREPERPYCSRICCIHSVRAAITLKMTNPEIKIHILYRDMRTYGAWETYYKEARDLGVMFTRYETDAKPLVRKDGEVLIVKAFDPIVRRPIEIKTDFLALATGVVAHDNRKLAALFNFSINSDGFFNVAHSKLRPVDLTSAGLFLAGICNYPKPMDEAIEQACAAAHRVALLLSNKEITSEAIKAFVTDNCDGCALCVDVCPFHAIAVVKGPKGKNTAQGRVKVDPALCQGCGLCAATCSNEGIMVHGFTMNQLLAQVRSAINEPACDME